MRGMKLMAASALYKHLQEAAENHLSSLYLFAMQSSFEKSSFSEKVYLRFHHFYPEVEWERFSKEQLSAKEFLERLEERSLFSSRRFVSYEGVESWKKADWESFTKALPALLNDTLIILTGDAIGAEYYNQLKGEAIFLDLGKEKPWDKRRRLGESLLILAKEQGKDLAIDALNLLLDRIGTDQSLLEQELHKLSCFSGSERKITLAMVSQLVLQTKEETVWKIAESVVFQEKGIIDLPCKDMGEWLELLPAMRYFLGLGLQVSAQRESGKEPYLPTVKQSGQLERIVKSSGRFPSSYFARALVNLFDLELLAKSVPLSGAALWDLLTIKIYA